MTGPASSVESIRADGGVRSRRSKTTRVSGRSRYAPRAVSSGIVGSSVPEPIAMASTSARSRWTRRLAAAPVSGVRDARRRRDRAVDADAPPSRSRTAAAREMIGQERPRSGARAAASPTPTVDVDAMLAQIGEAAAVHERIRILDRDHGAADAGLDDERRARSGASGVGAGLERAVERGAARPRARRRERDDLGVRSAGDARARRGRRSRPRRRRRRRRPSDSGWCGRARARRAPARAMCASSCRRVGLRVTICPRTARPRIPRARTGSDRRSLRRRRRSGSAA